jgi:hypothetical protein
MPVRNMLFHLFLCTLAAPFLKALQSPPPRCAVVDVDSGFKANDSPDIVAVFSKEPSVPEAE